MREAGAGGFCCKTIQRFQNILRQDANTGANFQRLQIFLDQRSRRRVLLHKNCFACAAAERFNADGASACEQIEKAGAADEIREDIEERFAKAVAGGAKCEPLGTLQ